MYVDPLDLARAISEASGEKLYGETLKELAYALSVGRGVAVADTNVYIVLKSPVGAYDGELTIVKGRLSTSRDGRKARHENKVVTAFLMECGGPEKTGPCPMPELCIPELTSADSHGIVGGDLLSPVHVTFGYRTIRWYRLSDVPIGGLFWFCRNAFRNRSRHLAVFQRVQPHYYGLVEINDPQQLTDTAPLIAALAGGQIVQGIAPYEGQPRLIRRGPGS